MKKPPSHCSEEVLNRNLEKGFIRYPLARGKPALEPRMGLKAASKLHSLQLGSRKHGTR